MEVVTAILRAAAISIGLGTFEGESAEGREV